MDFTRNSIRVHLILQVANKQSYFKKENRKEIFELLKEIVYKISVNESGKRQSAFVNGHDEHVHILFYMDMNMSIREIVNHIKAKSTELFNKSNWFSDVFIWHEHYGVFSVPYFWPDDNYKLIEFQEEYHKFVTFEDEFRGAMRKARFFIEEDILNKMDIDNLQ